MVLLYFMDGLRLDLAKKHMPFLAGLNMMPARSEAGYSCACHASMYTGLTVGEHGTWFVWKKGENSPYKFLDTLPVLKHINLLPAKYLAARLARAHSEVSAFSGVPMLYSLPLKYWSLFELSETEFWTSDGYMAGRPTLFKLLREHSVRHSLIGLSRGRDVFAEEKNADYGRDELIYYFIGDVDGYMHRYGQGAETLAYLRKVDGFIASTVKKAEAAGRKPTVICFSDHGHIETAEKLDPRALFRAEGLNIDDYIHLTESTFLRFWPRDEAEARDIGRVLDGLCEAGLGTLIDGGLRRRFSLGDDVEADGRLIFWLAPPRIFSNTIWGRGSTVRSMHGYRPELAEHLGVFASNLRLAAREYARMTDILPTVLGALDIEGYGLAGENLLSGNNIP